MEKAKTFIKWHSRSSEGPPVLLCKGELWQYKTVAELNRVDRKRHLDIQSKQAPNWMTNVSHLTLMQKNLSLYTAHSYKYMISKANNTGFHSNFSIYRLQYCSGRHLITFSLTVSAITTGILPTHNVREWRNPSRFSKQRQMWACQLSWGWRGMLIICVTCIVTAIAVLSLHTCSHS